jgi:hypothetical protein
MKIKQSKPITDIDADGSYIDLSLTILILDEDGIDHTNCHIILFIPLDGIYIIYMLFLK